MGGSNSRKTMAHVCTCDGAFASIIVHYWPSRGGGIQRRNRWLLKRETRTVDLGSWLSPLIAGQDDSDLPLLFEFCCWSLIVSRIVPLVRSCGLHFRAVHPSPFRFGSESAECWSISCVFYFDFPKIRFGTESVEFGRGSAFLGPAARCFHHLGVFLVEKVSSSVRAL